jgi:sterol desaturase/sphingolipid hydroxylase (fatty acid hydroxylase superfamily)
LIGLLLTAFLLGPPITTRAQIEAVFGIHLPAWPVDDAVLSLVVGFLVLDLLTYAVHRCEHAVPLLWRFHVLHHSDPDVDVTTSVRHHPVEYILSSAFQWGAVILLGIPEAVLLCHVLACFAMAVLTHGNIRLPERVERLLRPVIITVDIHRLHHSVSPLEANANFGAVLSVWDRIFGTYVDVTPDRCDRIEFGVRELPPKGCLTLRDMIASPWAIS